MLVGAAIRSVAAALAGDQEAANRVELQLPETWVCSASPAAEAEVLTIGFRSGTDHWCSGDCARSRGCLMPDVRSRSRPG